MGNATSPVTRFWAKVDRNTTSECWPWTGYVMPNGYGHFSATRATRWLAHRYAYELLVGEIPDGMHLDHLCRNRRCVNPAHLEVVTQAENNRRASAVRRPKSRCDHGHEMTVENTVVSKLGQRTCRI